MSRSEIRFNCGHFLVCCLALALFAAPASGQIPKEEQNCINELNKGLASVAKAQGKEICSCIKDGSKGKLGGQTIEECTTADAKGKVLKAKNKASAKAASKCTSPPSFGPTDPNTVNAVAVAKELILVHQIFGTDLDAAIIDQADDKEGGKCQVDVAKATKKCQDTRLKEYNKCKKDGLKSGSITGASGLEVCVGVDPKGKIAKACDDKLTSKIDKKCVGKLAVFPGCNDLNPPATSQDLASCLDRLVECEVCEALKAADDLSLFCEACTPLIAEARLITDPSDLIGGPLARGRLGDYFMQNGKIRVIIQKPQRNLAGIVGQFGGQIIDADLRRNPGVGNDLFEEWAVMINIENTAHYTSVVVLNDGSDGNPAILRATGVDDLLDFINGSTQIAALGFPFPAAADDRDLPVEVTTDYILDGFSPYLKMETTITNVSASETIEIFLGDFLSSLAQEIFQPGYGFGQPLVTTEGGCVSPALPCDFIAWSGEGEIGGVSYGYIHTVPATTSFNVAGLAAFLFGTDAAFALLGIVGPNFELDPAESVLLTRFLAVGDGDVAAIVDIRNEIKGLSTGTVKGQVTESGLPVAGAEVAVIGPDTLGPGTDVNVVSQFRTGSDGRYEGTLPAQDYELRVHKEGHLLGSPNPANITVMPGQTVAQNFTLPAPGMLRVTIEDPDGDPIAAKISIVGFDPAVDPGNTQLVLGLIENITGLFGDVLEVGSLSDVALPYGIARVLFVDQTGDSGELALEPGDYQIVVSHGLEYSIDSADVSITSGALTLVAAMVAPVIDTQGFISGDLHVHSYDSYDSRITRRERIVSMLDEGVDFFTPSEHGFRVDFSQDLADLGISDLISTAVNEEVTPPDYGHFGGFPLTIDPNQVNGGAVDAGREAPPGQDFPSFGNYGLTPGEIFAELMSSPGENTVQINHSYDFFDGGLHFDTGLVPPQSLGDPNLVRLDPSIPNFWDPGFTAIELWIETNPEQVGNFLGQTVGNWFNLMNQGIVRTGISNSDTHELLTVHSGYPRSFIASPTDDPGALAAIAETLAMNLNDGRVIGTNGPFMRVTIEGDPNEVGGLELGLDTIVRATGGAATVTVEVQSPTWAEFDTVEYYVNSETIADPNDRAGLPPLYRICPDFVQEAPSDFTINSVMVNGAERLEATTSLSLSGLTQDTWVVVMVRGTEDVSCPLFPVVPEDLDPNANPTLTDLKTCAAGDRGVLALAFSNPLFLDVDGNGDYDSPGVLFQASCP